MEKKTVYTKKRFILSMIAIVLLFCFMMGLLLSAIGVLAVVVIGGTVAMIIMNGTHGTLQLSYEECPGGLLVTGTTIFETRKIVIPDEVDGVPVIGIKEGAFEENEKLEQIVLPTTLRSIEARAFAGCTSLTAVECPDSLEYIGDEAFFGCVSLEKVTFWENVRFIGNSAFSDCAALKEISDIYAEEIGMQAFYFCESLSSVVIKEKVDKIGMGAFYGCSSLENLQIDGGEFLVGEDLAITTEELTMVSQMITYLTDTYSQYDWERR